jgi:mRNA-degrading endonuclease YafQ of YafQ-DinJ toxin-antitoxin module
MEIFFTPQFKRQLRKLGRKNPEYKLLIKRRVLFLSESPNHPQLRMHKLANKENEYAISVDHSVRIIFSREKNICYLLTIGSHDEVY